MKVLFPRNSAGFEAVLLNTAGGVTGGDRFDIVIEAEPSARITLTSQAAERIYRAQPGPDGRVRTRLDIRTDARMSWLPQETILFDGAALDRSLSIDLAPGARFLGVETLVFGRAASGETVREIRLRDRIDLRRNGELLFADRLRLLGDAQAELDRPGVAAGAQAIASVICAAPGIADRLSDLRATLPETSGAAAVDDDLAFFRLSAQDGFEMRRSLVPLLRALNDDTIPRTWTI